MKTIQEQIREARKRQGLRQSDLAKLSKVNRANISQVELGQLNMGLDSLQRIATALDIELIIYPQR